MQVSNSTGRNTDYRVGTNAGPGRNAATGNQDTGSGGSQPSSDEDVVVATSPFPIAGTLAPGSIEDWNGSGPYTVEFLINGTVVASESYDEDPGLVTLVETAGAFSIEVSASVPAVPA